MPCVCPNCKPPCRPNLVSIAWRTSSRLLRRSEAREIADFFSHKLNKSPDTNMTNSQSTAQEFRPCDLLPQTRKKIQARPIPAQRNGSWREPNFRHPISTPSRPPGRWPTEPTRDFVRPGRSVRVYTPSGLGICPGVDQRNRRGGHVCE